MRRSEFDRVERRLQIDIDDALKHVRIERFNPAALRDFEAGAGTDPDIGEHSVQAPIAIGSLVDCSPQCGAVRDIENLAFHRHSGGAHPRQDLRKPGSIGVRERYASAVRCHHLRVGQSKPARRAGDEDDMALNVE